MTTSTVRRALTVPAIAIASLALAACSGGGSDSADSPSAAAPASDPAASSPSADSSSSPAGGGQSDDAAPVEEAAAAASAAEKKHSGTVTEIDVNDDGSYDVEIVTGNAKVDATVAKDGSSVSEKTTKQKQDSDDDVKRAASATTTMTDAITTAGTAAKGEFTEAELTEDDGKVAYKVEIEASSGKHVVYVDAVTGAVIRVDQDD